MRICRAPNRDVYPKTHSLSTHSITISIILLRTHLATYRENRHIRNGRTHRMEQFIQILVTTFPPTQNTPRRTHTDSWNIAFGRYKNDSNISGHIRKLAAAICETVIRCADRIVIVTKTPKYYIFRLFRLFWSLLGTHTRYHSKYYIYFRWVFVCAVCDFSASAFRCGVGDLIKIAVEFNESHHRPTGLKCVWYTFATHIHTHTHHTTHNSTQTFCAKQFHESNNETFLVLPQNVSI